MRNSINVNITAMVACRGQFIAPTVRAPFTAPTCRQIYAVTCGRDKSGPYRGRRKRGPYDFEQGITFAEGWRRVGQPGREFRDW